MPDKRHYPSDVNLSSTFTDTVHLPSEFNLSDSDVATILAQQLGKYFKPEEIAEAQNKYLDKGWPEEYVNSTTNKVYKPHHLIEARALLSDTPKHIAILGGEGCLAAETPIAGIPIAELTQPTIVPTLFGQVSASPAFRKGRACLYRVRTQSGAEVVATSMHQFLTPRGWYPLALLAVGDVIAAYDKDNELNPVLGWRISFWSDIQSITYVKDGDFYDLHVPVANHYAAAGFWHHNSGKSVLGIIKDLERLRKGMSGVMISPDLEHTKKSIWPEFRRWCPWDRVVERQQYRQDAAWEPQHAFTLVFNSDVGIQSTLMIGGAVENDLKSWEGPNINFAHLDEMRRHRTPGALKTLLGRVRIPGPNGEPPQLYMTTTPSKHWLFDYFGPLGCTCTSCHTDYFWQLILNTVPTCPNCNSTSYVTEDPWHDFKLQSAVIRLRTEDNEENLEEGFAKSRALSLTAAEARVLLDAEWEDLSEAETFLPSLTLWDLCRDPSIPPLDPRDPIVLAIDAAKGRTTSYSDCFAIVGVSRHWDKSKRKDTCVVRFVLTWQAKPGGKIDFVGTESNPGPELTIRDLVKRFNVVQIAYDPYELHDFGMRLARERLAWFKEFAQLSDRTESDSDLLQLIIQRRIVHDGNQTLRSHIANADRKVSDDGRKFRIVKRLDHLKIDAAVALSMACYRSLHLNIA